MRTAPLTPNLEAVPAEESTMFDSLARLVPDELQTAYYRVLAHTRTLSPDDEMLRILEAMGILALLTRHTPKDIGEERERFQEMLDLHLQLSDEAQRKMLSYVRKLESRLCNLPTEIEAHLDPKEIAMFLGESVRQHFIHSGVPDAVKALQATGAAMVGAQKELSTALRNLDFDGGVAVRVERANDRLMNSLESRVKTVDALMHQWKSDLLRLWIPLIAGATLLIGLLGGMTIQAHRDSEPSAAVAPTPTEIQSAPTSELQQNAAQVGRPKPEGQNRSSGNPDVVHKR